MKTGTAENGLLSKTPAAWSRRVVSPASDCKPTRVAPPSPERCSCFLGDRSRLGCCSVRLAPNIGGVGCHQTVGKTPPSCEPRGRVSLRPRRARSPSQALDLQPYPQLIPVNPTKSHYKNKPTRNRQTDTWSFCKMKCTQPPPESGFCDDNRGERR
jgi:hypothetical protein